MPVRNLVAVVTKKVLPMSVRNVIRPAWHRILLQHDMQNEIRIRARAIAKIGPAERWSSLQSDELDFWNRVLDARNVDPEMWPDLRNVRSDPTLPLQEYLKELLNAPLGTHVEILDVGAGPLTILGKTWDGRHVHITAIDPNAVAYDELLARHGIDPPCRTRFGYAEDLSTVVPLASFDLVHARNCMDHSKDPIKAISEMVRAVKPGCYVFLNHKMCEGRVEKYIGPHQWNFFPRRGRFYIERPGMHAVDVGATLKKIADVSIARSPDGPSADGTEWFVAKIKRRL
jgi:SAM-dependent methyltransferase